MTREIQISRRTVFSIMGVALPATILAVSRGAAQTPAEVLRREEQRELREERREERREEQRRQEELREERSSGVLGEPATTGSAAPPEEGRTYHGGPKQDD